MASMTSQSLLPVGTADYNPKAIPGNFVVNFIPQLKEVSLVSRCQDSGSIHAGV